MREIDVTRAAPAIVRCWLLTVALATACALWPRFIPGWLVVVTLVMSRIVVPRVFPRLDLGVQSVFWLSLLGTVVLPGFGEAARPWWRLAFGALAVAAPAWLLLMIVNDAMLLLRHKRRPKT